MKNKNNIYMGDSAMFQNRDAAHLSSESKSSFDPGDYQQQQKISQGTG